MTWWWLASLDINLYQRLIAIIGGIMIQSPVPGFQPVSAVYNRRYETYNISLSSGLTFNFQWNFISWYHLINRVIFNHIYISFLEIFDRLPVKYADILWFYVFVIRNDINMFKIFLCTYFDMLIIHMCIKIDSIGLGPPPLVASAGIHPTMSTWAT